LGRKKVSSAPVLLGGKALSSANHHLAWLARGEGEGKHDLFKGIREGGKG